MNTRIPMITTTINNSTKEKPCLFICRLLAKVVCKFCTIHNMLPERPVESSRGGQRRE